MVNYKIKINASVYGPNARERMVVITAALTPCRFHFAAVWRGSSGLGKIRESVLAQFPSGLRSLQLPYREWSSFTKRRLCAFDLYSMRVTHMEKCFESEVFGHALHLSECNCWSNDTHSTPWRVLTWAFGAYRMLGDTRDPHDKFQIEV